MRTEETAAPVRVGAALAVTGTLVALAVLWYARPVSGPGPGLVTPFARWMIVAAGAGLFFRAARRKVFFGSRISWHEAASFDAIFQAAILFNPQLAYPDVESEFLANHTASPPDSIAPWFRVRATAALAIPLSLASIATALMRAPVLVPLAFAAAAAVWIAYRSAVTGHLRGRFVAAMIFGIAAAAAEGFGFTAAALAGGLSREAWPAFVLYSVLLAAFELSPVPLTLGSLEVGWLAVASIESAKAPGIFIAEAYRLFRALPVLLIALFYLPRYKMSVRDLYNRRLPLILARMRRKATEPAAEPGAPVLSVVLPAYNEAERLPRYLPDVLEYCASVTGGGEVLVVDDGSSDGTAAYVESLRAAAPAPVRLIRQPQNMGKGAAVRRGVMEARGAYILFADADGATPIAECSRLLQAAEDGDDVVIGSRKVAGDSVQRDRSVLREFIGSTFYRITNLLAVPGIEDTQCGFKLFRRAAARRIFPEMKENGWAFDVEVLFLAQKFGLTIEEVPVNWTAVEGSKVRPRDALRMLVALLRIRHRDAGFTAG